MKTLVWTSANDEMFSLLTQWVISLRTLGHYTGELLILDYGISASNKKLLNQLDVKYVSMNNSGPIVNHRYIDIIDILKNYNSEYLILHLDADIWFQKDMNGIFDLIDKEQGCLFSPDVHWYSQPFLSKNNNEKIFYENKIRRIHNAYDGTIQGGLSAGKNINLIAKYTLMHNYFINNIVRDEYGSDQFLFNILFEESIDKADAHLWNCIGSDIVYNNGIWYSKKHSNKLVECIGIHVVGMLRHEKHRLFKYNYNHLILENLKDINHNINKNIYIESLPIDHGSCIADQLISIINLCKTYYNHNITIGFNYQDIILCPYDIGCQRLVPLNHGHDHYWDILGLERKPHIADPFKLFISAKATNNIAQIPVSYTKQLCDKFSSHWLDFMLSMMIKQHHMSYGLII
jgi:hypothetical protein